jgi:flagellar basal-body rod protein FlgB
MTTENLSLFKAIGAKMDFLTQRQRVISQNVSNADTPGYRPHDLKDEDFGRVLKTIVNTDKMGVLMNTTDDLHMPAPNTVPSPTEIKQKKVYEVAPVGNAVIMEEQMLSSGKTNADYNLMTSLYQKNIGLIKTALGRGT